MQPIISGNLFQQETPFDIATDENIVKYGVLVDDYQEYMEKPESEGSIINFWWKGNSIYNQDESENDKYLMGWSLPPEEAEDSPHNRDQALIWSARQYPDAGQLYFPLRGEDYIITVAKAHKDITPKHFKSFYITGGKGIYLHPGIWHEGIIPLNERASFYKQGSTENKSYLNFAEDMGTILVIPLNKIQEPFIQN